MPPVTKTTLWLVLALASAAASASADERRQASDFGHSEAEIGPLRYSMALVDGGIALLDRQTGDAGFCQIDIVCARTQHDFDRVPHAKFAAKHNLGVTLLGIEGDSVTADE